MFATVVRNGLAVGQTRQRHQEKYSKIVIDYKAVMKAGMTGICCNRLGAVDIGYNPIIIIL
jgi:hypothetical protein